MLFSQQVIDGFNRIKGGQWHFNEDGVPVAHGSVPESGKLESFKFPTVLGLGRDESCGGVCEVRQVEGLSLIVLESTNEVYRVEVGTFSEHPESGSVGLVNLRGFKNLETNSAVGIVSKERSAARLTYIPDHAAYAHRAIELVAEIDDKVCIFKFLNVGPTAAEVTLDEVDDFFEILMGVAAAVELIKVAESASLIADEYASKEFFIGYGVIFESVGHDVVNVLDEDDVGIDVVEILNEGSVSARTEEHRAVGIAERSVVGIGGNGVGTGFLLGKADVELDSILCCILVCFLGDLLLEERQMVVTDGEVYMCLSVGGCIEGGFDEMFFHRGASSVVIGMEQ